MVKTSRRLCAIVLLSALAAQAYAQDTVRDLLSGTGPWELAYTTQSPPGPLDSWNRDPAKFEPQGAGLTMVVEVRHLGVRDSYPLTLSSQGFTFERAGVGQVPMRLDAQDTNAPFKAQVGNSTFWLVRPK